MTNNSNYSTEIFSIPFLHIAVNNWNEKKSNILSLKSSRLLENKRDNVITDFYSCVENSYSRQVEKIFKDEIQTISHFFNLDNHFVKESWMEVSNKNMCHYIHTHGPFGISVVCYVEYDEREHTPTMFRSPSIHYLTGEYYTFSPSNIMEGSLIAFPCNLSHFTRVNESQIPRTILSFNLSSKNSM